MRQLQEMRDASDLMLQFGPHKGSTLAQVAMSDPDDIRQLVRVRSPDTRPAGLCRRSVLLPNTSGKRAAPVAVGAWPDSALALMMRQLLL